MSELPGPPARPDGEAGGDEARVASTSDTKLCPFCAEAIQEAAIKCKHCGERLDAAAISPASKCTAVKQWPQGGQMLWTSNGDYTDLFQLIVQAIKESRFVLTGADATTSLIKFETQGLTWNSWAGEEVTVSVGPHPDRGAMAMFAARGKPSGLIRLSYKTSASKYTSELFPFIDRLLKARTAASG